MKTPMALSVTSSQREQTSLRSQAPRLPRSNVCSTRDLENPSASVHLKRFSTPSLTLKFLCAGKLNPRIEWSHDSPSGHQAKADRAPRFRQCLIIAPRSSTCRVQLHWRLGQGADDGRMARVAEAWDRSTAPGATSRSTISSASVRLQRLRLACRSGARLIPILATRHGRARPGHACLWTDILNPL